MGALDQRKAKKNRILLDDPALKDDDTLDFTHYSDMISDVIISSQAEIYRWNIGEDGVQERHL